VRRILFVDNQPEVLNAYRDSLKKYDGQLDAMFALGADTALEFVRNASIDVVVADMHMPGTDGPTLLGMIKEEHPDLVRIMVCPQSEMDSMFVALPVSHQVLGKPLDMDTLLNSIERTCRLRELLTDSLRRKIGALEPLPSVPAVYLELRRAMARPDVSNSRIARIIEKDAAMTAKALQLVNSACFGMSRHITSVDQAIAYLGMELIKDLSLTVYVFAALEGTAVRSGFSFDAAQEHSLITAKVAKQLMSEPRQAKSAFTAALLHDIGKLVLAVCIPKKFKNVMLICSTSGRPSHEVESDMLGVTHAEVGAYLLGLWGLPYPIVEAIAYHHNPSAALERTFDIPSAVALANALVEEVKGNRPLAIKEHLESLKVIHKLPRWTAIAREQLQQVSPECATAT
jgi:putative nucleotidyltransferase with HDIG domain